MLLKPLWISEEAAYRIHRLQLAEHGGLDGVRDSGLLQSATARPQQLFAYGEHVDLAALAASYAYGIARNHPFLDGNKRTALVVSFAFLHRNGQEIKADKVETYHMFLGLAEGRVSEEELAGWMRTRLAQA